MTQKIETVRNRFREIFGKDPALIVRSPMSVNLLGDHTEYNEGFVLSAALDWVIYMALAERADNDFIFHALDSGEKLEINPNQPEQSSNGWMQIIREILHELHAAKASFKGADCAFISDMPEGAIPFSTAVVPGAFSYAINKLGNLGITPVELVKLNRRAMGHRKQGEPGIADFFANIFAREGKVIRLDCRTFILEYHPVKSDRYCIVLCDSGSEKIRPGAGYVERLQECREAVKILNLFDPHVRALRDVSMYFLDSHKEALSENLYRRCRHIIRENYRVLNGCRDLQNGDMQAFVEKMYQSHESLRIDYEASLPDVDLLVDIAREFDVAIGARLLAASGGSCSINLVLSDRVDAFCDHITGKFSEKTGKKLRLYRGNMDRGISTV
jgi:galactokinase